MECLIIGFDFFINEILCEVFIYLEEYFMQFVELGDNVYLYFFVNIGFGVLFFKVFGFWEYECVGGILLGGGILWGFLSFFIGVCIFDEMLDFVFEGDNSNVDMFVGDIYGIDYGKIGLKSIIIVSLFGKVFCKKW